MSNKNGEFFYFYLRKVIVVRWAQHSGKWVVFEEDFKHIIEIVQRVQIIQENCN